MSNRIKDCYYHANAKGTGSAVALSLRPASVTSDGVVCPGSVCIEMAPQKTVPSYANGVHTFATFDWDQCIVVKLGRDDLSQIIQVLRGMRENVCDGKGLFHRSQSASIVIKFNHYIDPYPCYMLSVSKKFTSSGETRSCFFSFNMDESLALMLSLEQSLMYVCMGIPEVVSKQEV